MEGYFKVGLKKLRCNGVGRAHMLHDCLYWMALASTAMILRIP
jgi:hypothetical protein